MLEALVGIVIQLAILALANVTIAATVTAGIVLALHALRAKVEVVALALGLKK